MFILLLLSFLLLYLTRHLIVNRKYFFLPSPGPCLPVFGHIHYLLSREARKDPVNSLWQIYRKHNGGRGLMWLRRFNLDFVVVGDFNIVKELFNNPDVQERGIPGTYVSVLKEPRYLSGRSNEDHPGVVTSCGKIWSEQRRFALKTLKDFGFGKTGIEDMISEEVAFFTSYLRQNEDEPMNLIDKFNLPIINALWRITAGARFQYDDSKLLKIMEGLATMFRQMSSPGNVISFAFPWLLNIGWMKKKLGRHEFIQNSRAIIDLMRESVAEHKISIDTNEPRDFIDMMLIEINKTNNHESSFHKEKGEENLVNTLFDLFAAGSETTSTSLSWAVLYMVRNPEVQEKVQTELDQVVGRDRAATMKDKANLPYTQAAIMEIQRMANIVPQGLLHRCRKDVTINGLTLPKNTLVSANYAEILKGDQWVDGTCFRPERFLDEAGNIVRKEQFIPFSIGKRYCLGESLAKTELFLFFTGLMQQFTFAPPVPGQIPTEEYQPGLTIIPQPFHVRLTSRI